ncbi:hypothetical protein E4H12_13485 [Candidatus Thorarchaeota archaeon]|nr:MAG: hypothetical protein E4H12_13485 [Candidatus Thorarchaeota archaeon]
MFLPAKLDVRRLHDTIEKIEWGRPTSRGEGKTLAYIHLMIAEVLLGDSENRYLYVGENEILTRYVAHDFLQLFEELRPDYFYSIERRQEAPTMILIENQVFKFISSFQFIHSSRHHDRKFNRIFFDVSKEQQFKLDRNGELMNAFITLQSCGADFK